MKLNITTEHFLGLVEKGLTLDHIFILKLVEENYDVSPLCEEWERINGLKKGCERKGLLTKESALTIQGKEVLEFISSIKNKRLLKSKIENTDFIEWWDAFPKNNIFTYKNVSFSGSRSMRVKKDECRLKFESIVNEGEYTVKQLIEALKTDVLLKKEESFKTGANKLTYMQNSLTYLNQRSYENFIDVDLNLSSENNDLSNYNGANI